MRRRLPKLDRLAGIAVGVCLLDGTPALADIFYLREDCAGYEPGTCFTDTASLGPVWTEAATSPATVDVAPGDWGYLHCVGAGHVTFQGAGREHTRFGGVLGSECDSLGMEDLSVENGVVWNGSGSSTWSATNVLSPTVAWREYNCPPTDPATHTFYASLIQGNRVAVFASCSEISIYGSEIAARLHPTNTVGELTAIRVSHRGVVRVHGAAVRVITALDQNSDGVPDPPLESPIVARGAYVGPKDSVGADGFGRLEMSGGIMSLDASGLDPGSAIALEVDQAGTGTATAHVPTTAFVVKTGTGGTAQRALGPGISSAFLWEAGVQPPLATGEHGHRLATEHGQDLYVEIDCSPPPQGDCDLGTGTQPHLMIYAEDCGTNPGGPWFNVVTGRCRGEPPPSP